MQLETAIAEGNHQALNMAKSLLMNPMIISTGKYPWAFSLECEIYTKSSSAEVAEFPVIVPGTGRKQFLADNVAPKPITWQMSGYIAGDKFVEQVCFFTPIVTLNVGLLWSAYKEGARIIFKDMDCFPYLNCVISNLEIGYQKDVANKRPFKMTLQEIKTIEMSLSDMTEVERNANADAAGGATDAGSTMAEQSSKNVWSTLSAGGAAGVLTPS